MGNRRPFGMPDAEWERFGKRSVPTATPKRRAAKLAKLERVIEQVTTIVRGEQRKRALRDLFNEADNRRAENEQNETSERSKAFAKRIAGEE